MLQSETTFNSFSAERYFGNTHKVSLPMYVVGGILSVLFPIVGVLVQEEFGTLALSAALVGVMSLVLLFYNPRWWIYTQAALNYYYITSTGKDFDAGEIVTTVFVVVGLFTWFIWQTLAKKKLVDSFADKLILFVSFFLFANVLVALLNDISFADWGRQCYYPFFILYYFPIKTHLTKEEHFYPLFVVIGIVTFALSATALLLYKKATANIAYAYQIASGVGRVYNTYIAGGVSLIILLVFSLKKWWQKLLTLSVSVIGILAILSTFSRTFWVSVALVLVTYILLAKWKYKIQALLGIVVISISIVAGAFLIFPKYANIAIKALKHRITNTKSGSVEELAIYGRFSQYKAVTKDILQLPLTGQGVGASHYYYEPARFAHIPAIYIHNGYLSFAYRYGIPAALCFYGAIIIFGWIAFTHRNTIVLGEKRNASLIPLAVIVFFLASNFSESLYEGRQGPFILAYALGFLGFIQRSTQRATLLPQSAPTNSTT